MPRGSRRPSAALVVATLALVASVAFAALRFGGFATFIITGRSMEPAVPVGSLIVVQPVDPSTLREGDVVTQVIARQARTHRILVDHGNGMYTTKGDANPVADPERVAFVGRAGLVRATIPLLGYAVGSWRQHAQLAGMLTGLACLVVVLYSLRRRRPLDQALRRSRAGDHAGAIALLRSAVARDPLDRVAHRRLAGALAASGDTAGAAAEYARFIKAARSGSSSDLARAERAYADAILLRRHILARAA